MTQTHWQQFFGPDYLFFSEVILTPERTAYEIGQLLKLLELPEGASLLDFGCGQGRLSVPLAASGLQVTAWDGSENLLEEARRRAAEKGTELDFVLGDMKELSEENRFDAVINFGTAFGYNLSEDDDRAILGKIFRALKPGGQFVIDTENRDLKVRQAGMQAWYEMVGQPVWTSPTFDSVTGRWEETIRWYRDGEECRNVLNLRLYAATELLAMLREAGFTIDGVYGGMDFSPLTPRSTRMIIRGRKK
ncbi:methyltransferase domain-containing protein [Paenibacillus chitinolyticus]|uniref:class I SAM-dependent methyltransferase n=1 Tax=Paenibacillus chitinolyticus TaxID=79263 RepID=UPI002DB579DD|nr:methyltransferase domain-containing protein [Paenibacillus chitinolyticus]MEC0246728.1 methyltransferase domain-containing protein [Paenibacillus chitinolyticus]